MLVVQVVPRLPPVVDGVGDYALNLAGQLHREYGITTHFVVGDLTWVGATDVGGFSVSQVSQHSAEELAFVLLKIQKPLIILLHYVGYGYARRGCPLWLVEGIERSHRENRNENQGQLVTMFHELYAFGPPWTSSFWLSPVQKDLVARLARVSDRCLTSRQSYAQTLLKLSQGKQPQISTLPVFSNIGEPKQIPLLSERSRRLVVFGGRRNRAQVYQEFLAELAHACQVLAIEEILDIGPSVDQSSTTVDSVPIIKMGEQPASEVANILLNSLAGFFAYPTDYLAKSTIYAAYCACGMLPISPRRDTRRTDGVESGKHYWISTSQVTSLDMVRAQAIADHAHTWYQSHNLSAQAQEFFRVLG